MSNEKIAVDGAIIASTLRKAIELGASDIHITEEKRPVFRIFGKLIEMKESEVWTKLHINAFLQVLQIPKAFEDKDSVNSSFTMEGKRFRFHGYRSFTGISLALRVIPLEIPVFDNLNIPQSVKGLVKKRSGLVLVTGPTGSGKSTTLASLIDLINKDPEDTKLVVTVENPVEFIYTEVNARIIQREVGKNVQNYTDAVVDAMREDPDVILIGELQDREAIRNAITLAETGHLVLASLHSNGAAETFDRIIDAFPGDQQQQVRTQLSNSLQGIIHQRLIPKIGGEGRVPLSELLIFEDDDIRKAVRANSSVDSITKLMKEKFNKGLISTERSAAILLNSGLIDMDTAIKYSGSKKEDLNRIVNMLNSNNR